MATVEVFVVGSLHLDVIVDAPRLPVRGETIAGTGVAFVCGGKGGNQAVASAIHGARTGMAGRVGSDVFAERLVAHLDAAGVDRSQVQVGRASQSGMSVAVVDSSGEYCAAIVSGANLDLDPDRIALPRATRVLVLQNEIPEACNLRIAREARAGGATVILNAAPMREIGRPLRELVDILVVNRIEAAAMTGHSIASAGDAVAAASLLAKTAFGTVIVTLEADGVVLCDRDGRATAHPAFEVEAVSSHGAGDAFVGALASRLCDDATMTDTISYAQAAAALHVSTAVSRRLSISPAAVRDFIAAG